jgi:tetratricopeptide (TPR) repeat protein
MAYEPELEKLERRYQDDPARNFAQLAERYRKDGRLEEALALLRGHLADRPNYVSGLVVLGRCLLDEKNDDEARETFGRVLAVDQEHIIALRALGEISERAGNRDEAHSWFTRLLDVDPMNEEAEAALVRVAAMSDVPPAAEPAVDAVASGEAGEAAEAGATLGAGEVPETIPIESLRPEEETPPEVAAAVSPYAPAAGAWPDTVPAVPEPVAEEGAEPVEAEAQEVAEDAIEPVQASEWDVERTTDDFMPRASQAVPFDVEQIGDVDIASQLPDEAPLIGGASDTVEDEEYEFPTGEQEVDLGFLEPTVSEDEISETEELAVEPFDDSLGWGAGERVSRQITQADMEAAEHAHEATLDEAVHQLPGLEAAELADETVAADAPPVEGLQAWEPPESVEPIEGLEPTHPASADLTAGAESVEMDLPEYEDDAMPVGRFGDADVGDGAVVEEERADTRAWEDEGVSTTEAEPVEDDRRISERRAPRLDLPGVGQAEEPESPLVLEAEPEPVVTETMADLYVRQGLVNEAREVYQQLLAQRPGDPGLMRKLADLEREMLGAHGRRTGTFSAGATGGQSARALLGAILAAGPVVVAAPAAAAPAEVTIHTPAVTLPESAAPEPMDEAFGEGEPDDDVDGAPTRPAADEVSLSSVFGEGPSAPTTAPSPAPEPPQASKGRAPGGFSFDEFFGKASSGGAEGQEKRDSLADDEGDEQFRDWLKGLRA